MSDYELIEMHAVVTIEGIDLQPWIVVGWNRNYAPEYGAGMVKAREYIYLDTEYVLEPLFQTIGVMRSSISMSRVKRSDNLRHIMLGVKWREAHRDITKCEAEQESDHRGTD